MAFPSLPKRKQDSHKGDYGHVLVIAGSNGMAGAAILAGLGALRSGAGLVTVAVPRAIQNAVTAAIPEALTRALPLPPSRVREGEYSALAVGPGLSTSTQARKLTRSLAGIDLPLVLDADALNCLALDGERAVAALRKRKAAAVITPHPGELSRLLKRTTKAIQADRAGAARDAAKRFGVVCLLKGNRTVVTDGRTVAFNTTGNPGMARGGMGDVLTGLIGGFLAQGIPPFEAARLGAWAHGLAGDIAAKATGKTALLPRDLAAALPKALRRLG